MNIGNKVNATSDVTTFQTTGINSAGIIFSESEQREIEAALQDASILELYQLRKDYPALKSMIDPVILNKPLNKRAMEEGDDREIHIKRIIQLEELRL